MSGVPTSAGAAIVDADAVCEVCGNVNVETTFICRVCGNNLRDQKARRLAAEVMLFEPESAQKGQLVRGGLVVLALLVLAWTAVNANAIANRLMNPEAATSGVHSLFDGPDAGVYDAMLAEAGALAPTIEQVQALAGTAAAGQPMDGRYALVLNDPYTGPEVVGAAVVQSDGTGIRFVASFGAAGHLRGRAQSQGISAYRSGDNQAAGADAAGKIFGVAGVAVSQPDGTIECYGQSALDETTVASYEAVAIRLP